jgi:broad specificity phosphatase PhoE
LIKSSDKSKILIVTHSGPIEHLTRNMFNINLAPDGDVKTYGSNCRITYITYNDKKDRFKLVSPSNTLHLGLY